MASVYLASSTACDGWVVPCVYLVSVSGEFKRLFSDCIDGEDFVVYLPQYSGGVVRYIGQLIVQHCVHRQIIAEKLCARDELMRFANEFDVAFLYDLLTQ